MNYVYSARNFFVFFFLLSSFSLFGQYSINHLETVVYIDGKSSFHDWTEVVETVNGTLKGSIENDKIVRISAMNLTMPVESIKSGKTNMDKNTHRALKYTKYPNIIFKLRSYDLLVGERVKLTGALSLAGVTNDVSTDCSYKLRNDIIEIHGMIDMKMTDFGIDPPTAMLGTIVTENEITLRFKLVFEKD